MPRPCWKYKNKPFFKSNVLPPKVPAANSQLGEHTSAIAIITAPAWPQKN
jgi:hypothetical protein